MAARKQPPPTPDAGDEARAELEKLRDHLWAKLVATDDPFASAQLAAQHRGVVNDLRAMSSGKPAGSVRDDLKAKRDDRATRRGSTAAAGARAAGGRKPRSG